MIVEETVMSKSVVYVGVDVGKVECAAAVPGRRVRMFRHTGQGVRGLVQWIRGVAGEESVQVCMESTGIYSRRLALGLLRQVGVAVSIVNPSQIRAYRQVLLQRTKTDMADAEVILAYAESQHPPIWEPGSVVWEELTAVVKEGDRLRRLLVQSKNRAEHSDGVPAVVRRSERALQRCLREQIAAIEAAIVHLCRKDQRLGDQVALVGTIPGLGIKSTMQVLAYGGVALQDRSARELTAHAGLAPAHRQSGISVRGRSHICKHGDRRLRTALYMPTLVATRCNPILRAFYQRLIQNGKSKKLALIACMRKLLVMIRAILRTQRPFDARLGLT
jgi:transposase